MVNREDALLADWGQVMIAINRYQTAVVKRDEAIKAAHDEFNKDTERIKKITVSCKLDDENGTMPWEAGYIRPKLSIFDFSLEENDE